MIKRILARVLKKRNNSPESLIDKYCSNGRIPWSNGYIQYKEKFIDESLKSESTINLFKSLSLPNGFGLGIDERCVEYPWIFSKISSVKERLLDAGSTFNYKHIVEQELIKQKELTIYTYYPEGNCFFQKRINYMFGDLRELCFKDDYFDTIVSQSTIEHIDMDNSIYGYGGNEIRNEKSYEYMKAVNELVRVLKSKGKLLITFPFGKFENHGFFQQFDKEMLDRILDYFKNKGIVEITCFKYEKEGWRFAKQEELGEVISFNPHTGKGKGDDGAAHCRSIACIEFIKS